MSLDKIKSLEEKLILLKREIKAERAKIGASKASEELADLSGKIYSLMQKSEQGNITAEEKAELVNLANDLAAKARLIAIANTIGSAKPKANKAKAKVEMKTKAKVALVKPPKL